MYKINYRTKSVYLDDSVRVFKNEVYKYIEPIKTSKIDGKELEIDVEYHGLFYNKGNGEIKRRDGQNLDKCLYDILFEKWGLDDSLVFKGSWVKIHNAESNFTKITVSEYKPKGN